MSHSKQKTQLLHIEFWVFLRKTIIIEVSGDKRMTFQWKTFIYFLSFAILSNGLDVLNIAYSVGCVLCIEKALRRNVL